MDHDLNLKCQQALITTNSLRQTFNRRVVEAQQSANPPLALTFAIADHPWVDGAGGAAVRIAMTVGSVVNGSPEGRLLTVTREEAGEDGEVHVEFAERIGVIQSDLRVGAGAANARPLESNARLSSPGVKLHGAGFIVTPAETVKLGLGTEPGMERHIRAYRNGRDLTGSSRDVFVIDLFGLSAEAVRAGYPQLYQWVAQRVKPERDINNRATYRDNWWIFGEPRRDLRLALQGLTRYVATPVTAKHRTFQFLDSGVLADDALICVATDDALFLGVLSSAVHVEWALRTGSTLEDRPRYIKSACFETFPFPADDTGLSPALTDRIRQLAEQLDAHRKARQAAHDDLTLTGMYNVLVKLRAGEVLTARERTIHEHGLVAVLRSLHDELDAAVLAAYGWGDLAAPLAGSTLAGVHCATIETLLERLATLNAKRAAEEGSDTVRWLRPEFQTHAPQGEQVAIEVETEVAPEVPTGPAAPVDKQAWPVGLPEQIKAVADVLGSSVQPLSIADLEKRFIARGRWRNRLPVIVETLEALGRIRRGPDQGERWIAS